MPFANDPFGFFAPSMSSGFAENRPQGYIDRSTGGLQGGGYRLAGGQYDNMSRLRGGFQSPGFRVNDGPMVSYGRQGRFAPMYSTDEPEGALMSFAQWNRMMEQKQAYEDALWMQQMQGMRMAPGSLGLYGTEIPNVATGIGGFLRPDALRRMGG